MVGDALLDIIFEPEENDGVGMLIGEVISILPYDASLAHNSMQKRLMAFYGVLACCTQQQSNVSFNNTNKALQQECS